MNELHITNRGMEPNGGMIYPHLVCGVKVIEFQTSRDSRYPILIGDVFQKEQAIKACLAVPAGSAIRIIVDRICEDHGEHCFPPC
nr:hypothetical protein [Dyella sp. ASV24]